jgi:uncharacterized protein (TIGR03086 family)
MDEAADIDLLVGVLDKTAGILAGVRPDQGGDPTPCSDYDVDTLVNHLVGGVRTFAAGIHGRPVEGDPWSADAGDDPSGEFRAAADDLVAGWRGRGFDGTVGITGAAEVPAPMAFNMALMEYLTHGWDLAVATGQAVPFTEEEAEATLAAAQATLPPEYRGEGRSFGHIVAVGEGAPAVDRLAGFMGRDPAGAPSGS